MFKVLSGYDVPAAGGLGCGPFLFCVSSEVCENMLFFAFTLASIALIRTLAGRWDRDLRVLSFFPMGQPSNYMRRPSCLVLLAAYFTNEELKALVLTGRKVIWVSQLYCSVVSTRWFLLFLFICCYSFFVFVVVLDVNDVLTSYTYGGV